MWTIILIIVALYVGVTAILYVLQERLLYFPTRRLIATPNTVGLIYEDVRFEATDGTQVSGWFIPASADGQDSERTLLFFHGNAGNISHRLDSIEQFHRLGLNVFIIDYRGYGQSGGRWTTEAGTYLDAEAAWRYLTEDRQISPEQIIIFGRSLGGGVAAGLAAEHPPRVLILESTFTSVPDMAARQFPVFPVRLLSRIDYNTRARVQKIDAPLLIIHSPADEVIPYSHGQALFEAAPAPKQFLEISGGHNDGFIVSAGRYEPVVSVFINQHFK